MNQVRLQDIEDMAVGIDLKHGIQGKLGLLSDLIRIPKFLFRK